MIGLFWLAIMFGAIAFIPFFLERNRHSVDVFRKKAPGRFAKLSQGVTHYQWLGGARGPVIVCVHGLTTPSPVWYAISEGLAKLGYRILIYDLYGRGFSDAPAGVQDAAFFTRQLDDLLAHQEIESDITFLGYSMGGAIATAFTAQDPSRVRRLVLLASAGMWLRENTVTRLSRTWPIIGDWFHAVIAVRQERRALRDQLGERFDIDGIVELQLAEYQSQGFVRSVLSSRRNMLRGVQESSHRSIGRAGVPVVAIWAEKDEVIPLKSLGTLTQWNRLVKQEVIAAADHRVAYTHASHVVEILASILREDFEAP